MRVGDVWVWAWEEYGDGCWGGLRRDAGAGEDVGAGVSSLLGVDESVMCMFTNAGQKISMGCG
ncbi:hypothetical protein J2Z70_006660 [Paenibacillus silagei]|uniref:Uncharacterized protein n=1 Tax=Paenibacillus silagei TaxID=1670801 RepID=A0ABS4P294_9BACL|nr:hypothetical protein [Paenibacillus silagei]